MSAELGINAARTQVSFGGRMHPVTFGEAQQPEPASYDILPYTFQDEKGNQADGCLFEIKPFKSTTVMRVTDETVHMQEIAIKGHGWFLGINPAGEILVQEVGDLAENPLIEQRKGWVGVWIAGKDGMEVLDMTAPPFNPSMETPVKREDPAIPAIFWGEYDRLKTATDI